MRYLIVGTGGVGGYFGSKLANAGHDVWFLARGKHYEAMMNHGLRVKSAEGEITVLPEKIISDVHEAGIVDGVFFCVKSYDTDTAAVSLAPVLHQGSIVISFQNGIDNEAKIQWLLPSAAVLGGVAYISASITAPGEITKFAATQKLVFGPMDGVVLDQHRTIHNDLITSGIETVLSSDIRTELWKKLIFLSPVAGITAITRLTVGEAMAVKETAELVHEAMKEVESVALRTGVPIPPEYVDHLFGELPARFGQTRASLYFDLVNGKPLEIEALFGKLINLGKDIGVPTPVHQFFYSVLLPHHYLANQKAGR